MYPDGARVRTAALRFHLVDDLHRADLRSAGHGASREGRAKNVESRDAVS
jgi:hypothetical protein